MHRPAFLTHPLFLTPLLAWTGGFLLMLPIWPMIGSKELVEIGLFRREIVLPIVIHLSLVSLVCGFIGGLFRLQLLQQKNRLQQQNERLASQEDQLRTMLTERETLLRILAHDLSNSVSASHGLLEMLMETERKACTPMFSEHMDIVLDSLNNGRQLIDSTRKIMAVESGKIELTLAEYDLAQCAQEAIRQYHHKASQKEVRLEVTTPEQAPALIDPVIFNNCILGNLISNAIKFSYTGGEVAVTLSDAADQWSLCVRNLGPCIPEDAVEGLFSLHLKSSTPGTSGEAGTGFGLPLAKKFLNLMQGHIGVTSRPLQEKAGDAECETIFTILLPKATTYAS